MSKLIIKDLYANVEGKEILKGLSLEINAGEVHAIMGPNGTGKSTLSAVVMGNSKYTVTGGSITLDGEDVLAMSVDERAQKGLFLAMQYPSEISGITNSDFIRSAMNAKAMEEQTLFKYVKELEKNIEELKMDKAMAHRYLNEGMSGGEKKRNEVLQIKMLKPSIAILDEIDSGLDIDALTCVGENLTQIMEERSSEVGMLLITHYQRLLNFIKPTHVHIMLDGRIVETGDFSLVSHLEEKGYDELKQKHNIVDVVEDQKEIKIGSCATAQAVK